MCKYYLVVTRDTKKCYKIETIEHDTITEIYNDYVRNYATFVEKFKWFITRHKSLKSIKDERFMKKMFKGYFKHTYLFKNEESEVNYEN